MSRRSFLTAEVCLAMDRATAASDPKGLGFLAPAAFDDLVGLSRDVHSLSQDLTTAKFLWHWDSMGRSLDAIIARLRQAPDATTARRALDDLLVMLTDEDRWR
jgi:hypothetical protein